MPIICCGINHRTSSLAERELFQLQRYELAKATADFKRISGFEEIVILATCNRIEFYCKNTIKIDPKDAVISFYKERRIENTKQLEDIYFVRHGTSASRHLFKVTSGLDSPLLGEYQVLGQTKDAYSAACSVNGPSKYLHKLFHHAFHIAKLVRNETDIGSGIQSLAGASIEMVLDHFNRNLKGKKALIIGVNNSTEMLLSRLANEGADITVTNRTYNTAVKVARPYNASVVQFEVMPSVLKEFSIIFSVTSSPGYLIKPECFIDKSSKSIIAIDLAVPRDIDPLVGDIDYVTLLDLDDLKVYLDKTQTTRAVDLPYALDLIEEQVRIYELWYKSAVGESSSALRELLEIDRKEILSRFKESFRQGDQKALDAMSKNMYRQFLRRINNTIIKDEDGG
ncbi:glutamyl-tRNA reductase [bacterium]|nr:glutamyl-tRNA reductase [bacterium]